MVRMADKLARLPISFDSFRERFPAPLLRIALVRRWPCASSELNLFPTGAVAPEDFATQRTGQRIQVCRDYGIDSSNWRHVIICPLSVALPPPCSAPDSPGGRAP